jgi:F0F1-type ATP synthase membrane subunit b/b'
MPQLCIETFVTQYFWFVAIFILIYWFNSTKQLPKISQILFVRDQLISTKPVSANTKDSTSDSLKINIIPVPQRTH